jgi:L-threonylcarbamoyladenylate synthase
LVRAVGRPITAPSASTAGMPPPGRIEDARAYFGSSVGYYLDAGPLRGAPPSTVIDLRAEPRVIRAGAVAVDDLRASLGSAAASW